MIRLSAGEILSFLLVFGLMCFGLGVIFMQYRRFKEATDKAVKLVLEIEATKKQTKADSERELEAMKKELEKEYEQKEKELILDWTKRNFGGDESPDEEHSKT